MELLIIKSGKQYIRFKDNGYQRCTLDKASVFPTARIRHVQNLLADLRARGVADARIKKLILTEEPFKTR